MLLSVLLTVVVNAFDDPMFEMLVMRLDSKPIPLFHWFLVPKSIRCNIDSHGICSQNA